jgi:hypothetical protein
MDKLNIFKSPTSHWVDLQRAARREQAKQSAHRHAGNYNVQETCKGLLNDEDGRLAYHGSELQESRMEAKEEREREEKRVMLRRMKPELEDAVNGIGR